MRRCTSFHCFLETLHDRNILARPLRRGPRAGHHRPGAAAAALPAHAAGEVTVYTTREPGLIQPLLAAFAQNDVKVNTVFVKDGLLERVKAEARSPADVLDIDRWATWSTWSMAAPTQPVKSAALESAIPANLRAPTASGSASSNT